MFTELVARTPGQRRADAVTAIFRHAADGPTSGESKTKTVTNITVDYHTWSDMMTLATLFPERHVDPFDAPRGALLTERRCETIDGDIVDPIRTLHDTLEQHVRFVILDSTGIPVTSSKPQRLFKGNARHAVMMLSPHCTHPGCRRPTSQCQADHLQEWSQGGTTDASNGGPRCSKHNRAKHQRHYTVHRDPNGTWHTYRPDGTEI